MNNLKDRNFNPDSMEGEFNLVEMWCNPRSARLKAGLIAGVFAGVMMQIYGMIYCAVTGNDILAPTKIAAVPFLGRDAMAYGSVSGMTVGLLVFFVFMSLLGMAYAHFTGINHKKGLVGMGLTWGAFGWVFISCLMFPSFRSYLELAVPKGVMFFAWLVYGVSLASVQWFDKEGYKSKAPARY